MEANIIIAAIAVASNIPLFCGMHRQTMRADRAEAALTTVEAALARVEAVIADATPETETFGELVAAAEAALETVQREDDQ